MEKLNTMIKQKSQLCSECGVEYMANFLIIINEYDMSGGRCSGCRSKMQLERESQEEAARLAEIASKRRQYRLTCGIPKRFQDKDFSTFDIERPGNVSKVMAQCLEYASNFPFEFFRYSSLLLFGANGLGKTHLSAAMGHRILDRWQGKPMRQIIKFVSEPELLNSIQATYNYDKEDKQYRESEEDITNACIYTPLLILDDVAKEERTDMRFVRRKLFQIIDGRYKRDLPIVLTTNKNESELEKYLSSKGDDCASFDRLLEMCKGKFIKLIGESYRRKN